VRFNCFSRAFNRQAAATSSELSTCRSRATTHVAIDDKECLVQYGRERGSLYLFLHHGCWKNMSYASYPWRRF